jgi:hypothetical protein
MLPPEEYERAARDADYHLQMLISSVVMADAEADVIGEVVRVYRGPKKLLGTAMTLRVQCDDDCDDWAPDGLGRVPADSLRTGRVLEAYVNALPEQLEVALNLCMVIDRATESPQLHG